MSTPPPGTSQTIKPKRDHDHHDLRAQRLTRELAARIEGDPELDSTPATAMTVAAVSLLAGALRRVSTKGPS